MLFLISTLNDGDAIRHLLLHQYPQFTQPLNLMRVLCVFLALGKLGYGEVFSSNDGNAIRRLLLLQYPQFTQPLNLMRVFCVFLALGKLGYGEVFSSFVERRPA